MGRYQPLIFLLLLSSSAFARTPHYYERMDPNIPSHAVLFIGDSMLLGLPVTAITWSAVNFGIGGDTTIGVLRRIPLYESVKRARAVVISVGINDVVRNHTPDFEAISNAIDKRTPVIFCAILLIDEAAAPQWKGKNEIISELNARLQEMTERQPNRHFLDINTLVKGMHIGDGVHLNAEGNAIWIKVLRERLNELYLPTH